MFPARIVSTSSGGTSTSASSIAGPSAPIAAAAAAREPPPGRPAPISTAISGSAAGLIQPASDTVAPEATTLRSSMNPTSGPGVANFASAAGAPNPTFQPIGAAPDAMWRDGPAGA